MTVCYPAMNRKFRNSHLQTLHFRQSESRSAFTVFQAPPAQEAKDEKKPGDLLQLESAGKLTDSRTAEVDSGYVPYILMMLDLSASSSTLFPKVLQICDWADTNPIGFGDSSPPAFQF